MGPRSFDSRYLPIEQYSRKIGKSISYKSKARFM